MGEYMRVKSEISVALLNLVDECISNHLGGYNYVICFDKEARQGDVLLGTWDKWTGLTAFFKDGDKCPGNVARTLEVRVECGGARVGKPPWAALTAVTEPRTCRYEATVQHPAACTSDNVKA